MIDGLEKSNTQLRAVLRNLEPATRISGPQIKELVQNLTIASENFAQFSAEVKRRPSLLLWGTPPERSPLPLRAAGVRTFPQNICSSASRSPQRPRLLRTERIRGERSPRVQFSGVSPEDRVRRDAEHHTRGPVCSHLVQAAQTFMPNL